MKTQRLLSLDALRGLTIALMIVVNNPGSWDTVYPPLLHSEWHGCTPTDLVFPFFLFIVGAAMAFSFAKFEQGDGVNFALHKKIISRSIKLILLGWFLSLFPEFDFGTMRFFGVLPRIGICYFAASMIILHNRRRGQILWAGGLLIGYWLLMTLIPFPGRGENAWIFGANLAQYLDNLLLAGHMWQPDFEPEGIISTLPAIAQVVFGYFTGRLLRSTRDKMEITNLLFITGSFSIFLALCLEPFMPINKQLWTTSYVFYTSGIGLNILAICYWFIDIKQKTAALRPFIEFGSNAIIVYFGSDILATLLWKIRLPLGGKTISLQGIIYHHLLQPILTDYNASLAFAILFTGFWFAVAHWLYKKNIFFKI